MGVAANKNVRAPVVGTHRRLRRFWGILFQRDGFWGNETQRRGGDTRPASAKISGMHGTGRCPANTTKKAEEFSCV
jgi:hypothetical protein